jgi:hypothetical protein
MFKSAVSSDCLMMTGKFAGLGVYGGNVSRDQRFETWNWGRQRLSSFEGSEGGGGHLIAARDLAVSNLER